MLEFGKIGKGENVGFKGINEKSTPSTLDIIKSDINKVFEKGATAILNKIPGVTVLPKEDLVPEPKKSKKQNSLSGSLAMQLFELAKPTPEKLSPSTKKSKCSYNLLGFTLDKNSQIRED